MDNVTFARQDGTTFEAHPDYLQTNECKLLLKEKRISLTEAKAEKPVEAPAEKPVKSTVNDKG